MKQALIFQIPKSSMQSGAYKSRMWFLKFFDTTESLYNFDIMNWQGGSNTLKTICLKFSSQEEAVHYAEQNNIKYKVIYAKARIIKPKSYASNFY